MLLTLCSQLSTSRQPAEALTFHSTRTPPGSVAAAVTA